MVFWVYLTLLNHNTAKQLYYSTSNFKSIKVFRRYNKKRSIIELKEDSLTLIKIDISSMDIVFGNGSGAGGSIYQCGQTSKQENATRFVCEHFMKKAIMLILTTRLKKSTSYDDGWANTFEMQAKAFQEDMVKSKQRL